MFVLNVMNHVKLESALNLLMKTLAILVKMIMNMFLLPTLKGKQILDNVKLKY